MAHPEQTQFVALTKLRNHQYFNNTSVLEIGSYNVNGSVRQFFDNPKEYIGLDLAPGKDVDVVCHGADYAPGRQFDVVISTECFEHDSRWYLTFENMIELCRPGGLVIFTCAANNRHEHGTPRTTPQDSAMATDYYKNLNVVDFEKKWNMKFDFSHYCFEARDHDLYFWGVKR